MTAVKLESFYGKYLGFFPTDESSMGLGEVEMIITAETIVIRMATGLEIQEEVVNTSEFEFVSEAETLKKLAEIGSIDNVPVVNIVGELRHISGVPTLTFVGEIGGGIDIVSITGTMADLLGPTCLFSQAQIDKGVFNDCLAKLEEVYGKDQFPRLANNGKAKAGAD